MIKKIQQHVLFAALVIGTKFMPAVQAAQAQPAQPVAVEAKVAALLQQMTEEEKLSMLGGVDAFFIRGVERLGIPRLRLGDGPVGVRNWGQSTLYPATVLLAATWSEELATRFGDSLGRDSRARGMHVSLAPGLNIYRSPLNGRNYEYMGEDPFLASRLGVASVRAVQARGVAATVKHFAANNSETRRSYTSNEIDERTLREIYLPAFRAAVQEGRAWAVMNAYNLLNGEYCTANDWLTNQVLKKEWGFPGVVMSDWNATHDTLGAALGGLDLEMPAANYFAAAKLQPLMRSGTLPAAVIDDKVRRILRMIVANGWLEQEQQIPGIPLDDPTSAATALEVARAGITLLKNKDALLPLDADKVKTIAVVGPNAFQVATGLGSGKVKPFYGISMADGLKTALGAERVIAVPWSEPLSLLENARYARLQLELFSGRTQAKPRLVTSPASIALAWDKDSPGETLTARDLAFGRWTGEIEVVTSGSYQFVIEARHANVQIWIDGVCHWDSVRESTGSFTLPLQAGKRHALRVETEQRKRDTSFSLRVGWGAAVPVIPLEYAEAVKSADAVLVGVGFNVISGEGEGYDRSYALPGRQEELIQAVAQLNPRTIVALNAGGSVATASWVGAVSGLLHTYYFGQEGGRALAEILLGKVNPSGRLPFSYEQRWEDCAAYGNYPPHYTDTSVSKIYYREGIFLGYRWFDAKKIEPLFPFGHGLSYTTFAYGNMTSVPTAEGVEVEFDVTNTGPRPGAEVAQLYVGQPGCSVPRPLRELKGFSRVTLAAGETKRVRISLGRDAFQFFHPERKQWTVEAGEFTIEAGGSSRALPLKRTVRFGP